MSDRLINTGYGNYVAAGRIIAIVAPDSAPIKRTIRDAQEHSVLIDATYGRRTRAVIITDSGHVILCAMQPDTLAHRFDTTANDGSDAVVPTDDQGDNEEDQ